VKCKSKSETSNNREKWNHLKFIQKIPEVKELQKTAILCTDCTYDRTNVKAKVKFTLEQAMKPQKGSGGIALLFL
jgi:hypothetical protein